MFYQAALVSQPQGWEIIIIHKVNGKRKKTLLAYKEKLIILEANAWQVVRTLM